MKSTNQLRQKITISVDCPHCGYVLMDNVRFVPVGQKIEPYEVGCPSCSEMFLCVPDYKETE